ARLAVGVALPAVARRHRLHRDLLSRPADHRSTGCADVRHHGGAPGRRAGAGPRCDPAPRPRELREWLSVVTRTVLGVDVGTSSTKGVLVDGSGEILRSAVREHEVQRPAPGHVEMDAETWWDEFVGIATELLAPGDVEVAAAGVS